MLNWSANLTMLFKDLPFVERLHAAASAGFGAVEFMWPTGVNLDELVAARIASGVQVVLFNMDSGDVAAGDRGFPNDPSRRAWWRTRLMDALELAERLGGCPRLNIQAGNEVPGLTRSVMLDCLTENLDWALEQTQTTGISLFLEPLNRFEHPHYILSRTSEALEVLERLRHPRLKLQFDLYHTQRTEGNLISLLRAHHNAIGHIQIADSPARHQPGTGEIAWRFVLGELETLGYTGFIGLEYIPVPDTLTSLQWLPTSKRRACTTADLIL
ncbi:MAG: TIM barrel protein [Anaerolineae bacterium]|jgi:hydroxypyruvate isomerase|nr:TIM barrel protein [Anaerolineae bacterium]